MSRRDQTCIKAIQEKGQFITDMCDFWVVMLSIAKYSKKIELGEGEQFCEGWKSRDLTSCGKTIPSHKISKKIIWRSETQLSGRHLIRLYAKRRNA